MKNRFIVFIISVFLFSCASTGIQSTFTKAKVRIQGEYYLDSGKYDKGIAKFKSMLSENPENADIHYYLGRFYLSKDKPILAKIMLEKAVKRNTKTADFYFWLGVAYAANSNSEAERKSYLKALSIDKNHVQTMVYLGHNLYDSRAYSNALRHYDNALRLSPEIPSALYNRAMILRKLKRKPEEISAWKSYLDLYRGGAFARRAAQYLNAYGDYEYRNYRIGRRSVTMKSIEFINSETELSRESKTSIEYIGKIIKDTNNLTLHIVSFQTGNKNMAEKKAKTVKAYFAKKHPNIPSTRVKVSWFDKPQAIKTDKYEFLLDESVHFFTVGKS